MRVARIQFKYTGTETVKDGLLPLDADGFGLVIKVTIPSVSGSPTATLSIYDLDGDLVFSKDNILPDRTTILHAIAENKDIPLIPGARVTLAFTTAPGDSTSRVTIYAV